MNEFNYYHDEEINDFVAAFFEKFTSDFHVNDGEQGLKYYRTCLQDVWFTCSYNDEELRALIRNSILLIELMKKKIDSGYDLAELKTDYQTGFNRYEAADNTTADITATCYCANKITEGDEAEEILNNLYSAARVGGAYLMLVAGPMFKSAIYSVYEILCKYKEGQEQLMSDPELFAIYFLSRAAMKMYSSPVSDNQGVV